MPPSGCRSDPDAFIAGLQEEMREALRDARCRAAAQSACSKIHGQARRLDHPHAAGGSARSARMSKLESRSRPTWPMTSLLDMLKEADLRLDFTDAFRSPTGHETLDRATLRPRLLLCLNGLGTNTGLKRMDAGPSRGTDLPRPALCAAALHHTATEPARGDRQVTNGTLRARNPAIWGEGTTACASDSKQFGAWDQNLMTQWHVRYGGRGIMIYWHVERRARASIRS